MIGNFFLKIFTVVINLIDQENRSKIRKFFKLRLNNQSIYIFDIGAHKGETIELFIKNFNINRIYSFEPNLNLYEFLIKKKEFISDKIKIFNLGFGLNTEIKELSIFQDTSSSTLNHLNENTEYFKRKKKFMSLFFNKDNFVAKKQKVKIYNLSKFINEKSIQRIDILKIDTEGYEYNILKGIDEKDFKKIRFIYFEHHYDLMINKGYKFSHIKKLLEKNNFEKRYKLRMRFRKSFEYIYENKI